MSFQFTILEDKLNLLLNRRELKIFLKSAAGKISKIELVKIIAKNFNEDEKKIFLQITEGHDQKECEGEKD